MKLDRATLADLVRGAAFLGTGGGGDPHLGRLMAEQVMDAGHTIEIVPLEDVPDDALVIPTAVMGAPTVLHEKIPGGDEAVRALGKLEQVLGRKAWGTMPIEVGGVNSVLPLVVGGVLGLPVVDADGMGRAFPEIQMETFGVYGVSGSPIVLTNEFEETVVLEARDNKSMEWIARGITIRFGGSAYIAEYAMSGETAKRVSIPNTLTLATEIGRTIRQGRESRKGPFAALLELFPKTTYATAKLLAKGKITDVLRQTGQGFTRGRALIDPFDGSSQVEITFQNENLVARQGGLVRAIVPDLICILDDETAEPITTETLRYGQRVKVMAVGVPAIMRTPEALAVFGPSAFGLADDYVPVEALS